MICWYCCVPSRIFDPTLWPWSSSRLADLITQESKNSVGPNNEIY